MGRYVMHRVNDLTSFILSSAPSSLGTNKHPKLKIKINRSGVAKSRASKIDAAWKKHSTDELYLFRGLQKRHQPAEIWIRARLLSALCQTQTHIEHSGCSGIFTNQTQKLVLFWRLPAQYVNSNYFLNISTDYLTHWHVFSVSLHVATHAAIQ